MEHMIKRVQEEGKDGKGIGGGDERSTGISEEELQAPQHQMRTEEKKEESRDMIICRIVVGNEIDRYRYPTRSTFTAIHISPLHSFQTAVIIRVTKAQGLMTWPSLGLAW